MPAGAARLSECLAGRDALRAWRAAVAPEAVLGFVPTMGALHEGHGELVRRSAAECGATLVSIFVNPLQFDEAADYDAYPRTLDADCRLLAEWGATAVYLPSRADLYPEADPPRIAPGPGGSRYEGECRPRHFAGMLTVVERLFAQARPARAYFGEKDAQQLFLVRRLVAERGLPTAIVACPTAREADGLARSSRNRRLAPAERARAIVLYRALLAARAAWDGGAREPRALERAMTAVFRAAGVVPDYAAVVDEETFLPPRRTGAGAGCWRAVVAARIGAIRLIDNLLLGEC